MTLVDLNGRTHTASDLVGHPTLVIVVPSRAADPATRSWLDAAHARFGKTTPPIVTMLAVKLPPLVPGGLVRRELRGKIQPADWSQVWMDSSGAAKRAMGLPHDDALPTVFALDARGRVVASAHGAWTSQSGAPLLDAIAR